MNGTLFHRMIIGLLLIGAGSLFLLKEFNLIEVDIGSLIGNLWPLVLIYFGSWGAFSQWKWGKGGSQWIWSLIPVVLGFYFLGQNFGVIEMSFGELIRLIIPIALIVIGLSFFFRPRKNSISYHNPYTHDGPLDPKSEMNPDKKSGKSPESDPEIKLSTPTPPDWTSQKQEWKQFKADHHKHYEHHVHEMIHQEIHQDIHTHFHSKHSKSSFIGDIHLGQDYWELEPLNISQFIGDTVLDLTKAQIPYGETRINVSSFIGDVKVLVPNDYEVGINAITSSFLGDTTVLDKRIGGLFKNTSAETPSFKEAEKKIRLVTSTFIGDVTVIRVG
ncbi:hypothetical protein SY83_22345 [Paenibacillus swuensis]|uniref:Cell wall-active antibiotics response protein n=1 Tax=Paenibacillus swuensis TaxID=1178515 RepID=A0A172TNL7_9BACL|nr:cell wall-active antibiotics response protein LiaF [Paenibacillus swuensis]ANE48572.1 hypothetical protein SY83_22345 [Paenibacillus swuensis]